MSVPQRDAGREEPGGKAETILAAAEHAFLARGFGAVTMDAIAREAGVSKATVYAHFTGKEELFGAVIARVSERRFGGFSAEALDPVDIAASLTTIAIRFLDLVLAPEVIALNRIIIGEVTRFPVLGPSVLDSWPGADAGTARGVLSPRRRSRCADHPRSPPGCRAICRVGTG